MEVTLDPDGDVVLILTNNSASKKVEDSSKHEGECSLKDNDKGQWPRRRI